MTDELEWEQRWLDDLFVVTYEQPIMISREIKREKDGVLRLHHMV